MKPAGAPIWADTLTRAVTDRKSDWRIPQLATISPDGYPNVRSVVLRACLWDNGLYVEVHSHRQTQKIRDILANACVSLVFWSPQTEQQLRLWGFAEVSMNSARARASWDAISPSSRALYAVSGKPGQPVSTQSRYCVDYDGFALITVKVTRTDYLDLNQRPHFRETAEWCDTPESWTSQRIYP